MAPKTYGTVSAEQRKSMSGLEFVKDLASGVLPLNTFAKTDGSDQGREQSPKPRPSCRHGTRAEI
jgi:hypothetical protein